MDSKPLETLGAMGRVVIMALSFAAEFSFCEVSYAKEIGVPPHHTSDGSTLMFSPLGRTVLRCLSLRRGFLISNASAPSA